MSISTQFYEFFEYQFFFISLISIIFVAVMAGALSPIIVAKQRTYLSEALAHLVFPGVILAYGFSEKWGIPLWLGGLLGACVSAFIGTAVSDWIKNRLKVPPDASAMITLAAFLSLGIVIASTNKGALSVDPERILFGDVLALGVSDTIFMGSLCVLVFGTLYFLRKDFEVWVVDPEFGQISGYRMKLVSRLFPILLTLVAVTGIFSVGGLIITSLLTFPSLALRPRHIISFKVIMISVLNGVTGLFLAFLFDWPVGPTIAILSLVVILLKTIKPLPQKR